MEQRILQILRLCLCPMQIFFGIHMLCPAQVYKKRPILHLERGHILWQIGVRTGRGASRDSE